jgi:DNA-directed RNA polymerase subunit RPC12/RpoP
MPTFEYVYKCDNCGAEFSEADGVKTGDACPKCSGGSNFRLRGGTVRGLVALAALAAGGIGWAVKKASGKA